MTRSFIERRYEANMKSTFKIDKGFGKQYPNNNNKKKKGNMYHKSSFAIKSCPDEELIRVNDFNLFQNYLNRI